MLTVTQFILTRVNQFSLEQTNRHSSVGRYAEAEEDDDDEDCVVLIGGRSPSGSSGGGDGLVTGGREPDDKPGSLVGRMSSIGVVHQLACGWQLVLHQL